MATLSADNDRTFEEGVEPILNDLPVIASDIIYAGAAVGENGSGYMRPLVGGDPFAGFAEAKVDNSSGSAGDLDVRLRTKGITKLTVVGASAVTDINAPVYASDDATFTLTSTGASLIGKVHRWVTSTTCMVLFDVEAARQYLLTLGTVDVAADALVIPVTHRVVMKATGADAEALTLADGIPGQRLTINLETDGGGDGTLTPATADGWATVVLADAGDIISLEFVNGTVGWQILGTAGVLAPPVISV